MSLQPHPIRQHNYPGVTVGDAASTHTPQWKPNFSYTAGDRVVRGHPSPFYSRIANGVSAATWAADLANWTAL